MGGHETTEQCVSYHCSQGRCKWRPNNCPSKTSWSTPTWSEPSCSGSAWARNNIASYFGRWIWAIVAGPSCWLNSSGMPAANGCCWGRWCQADPRPSGAGTVHQPSPKEDGRVCPVPPADIARPGQPIGGGPDGGVPRSLRFPASCLSLSVSLSLSLSVCLSVPPPILSHFPGPIRASLLESHLAEFNVNMLLS